MATINSLKSKDNVMDQISIYLDNLSQKPMVIKTYDYKTSGEIKQIIIDLLKDRQQGLIQYKDSYIQSSYASYNIVVQIRHKKQPEIAYTRKINPLERPFEIKQLLQQNSKIESFFIFEDSSNTVEYIAINPSPKMYQIQEKQKYIRMGHLGKLKKNESFVELLFHLYPDHIIYSQVKTKNASVKIIPLANAHIQQLISSKYKNCFQVIGTKIYTFKANSKLDLQGWLVEIYKSITNLQDKKLLDQIDEDMMKSERHIQNYIVQTMDRSNMRCFKCIKKLAYRDKFLEFLMQEQERYFINQTKQNDKYQTMLNIIEMVDFIAKTNFNFPPFESVQNNGNNSLNNSLGSSNNLDMSCQGSYTQRKHSKSQDCAKLLKDFFDSQMSVNKFFSNFVFKLLEKMHRLQYSKLANAMNERHSNISHAQGIYVKSNEASNYSQIQLGRISGQSAQGYQNNQGKDFSPMSSITSGQSTPAALSRFNTNNLDPQTYNKEQSFNNNELNKQNNITEWNDFRELQTKNVALYEFLRKKQVENLQQNTYSPQPNPIQTIDSPLNSQQQQSSQSLIQFSQSQQSTILQEQQQPQLQDNQTQILNQQIVQSRKTTNQSTTSSHFYSNNNQILHEEILKYFNQQSGDLLADFKFSQDQNKQIFSQDELNTEFELKQPQSEREISDSIFFQNVANISQQTALISIEFSQSEFEKQVQQFTSEQMLNLILGYIEVEAFSSYVKNGQYYKQVIKSRQQIYQQSMPNFEIITQIINPQSSKFPSDLFTNQISPPSKNGQNTGIAKVAKK